MNGGDRHSIAAGVELITDPDELAEREVANAVEQWLLARDIILQHVGTDERPFKMRPYQILTLNGAALKGIHPLAGTFRNSPVSIGGSKHEPPEYYFVSEFVTEMCDYVNRHMATRSPIHLAAYVLWRLNWIHPFADGNGRTARMISYVVMSVLMKALLPGAPTVPEQIADDKQPYYDALEAADVILKETNVVDLSAMESLLDSMLARQLLSAARDAASPLAAGNIQAS